MGRGRAHERARDGERRARIGARRRRPVRLLPDCALLRAQAARAADHARTPDPARGFELRDLQDGGRAVRRAQLARLDLVPARERVRPAQPLGPATDVLRAADAGQERLRHGHAARLHLRRRSCRLCPQVARRLRAPRAVPHLFGIRLLDQGAVRQHDQGARHAGEGRRRGAAARRGRCGDDPARPHGDRGSVRLEHHDAARGGRGPRDRLLP